MTKHITCPCCLTEYDSHDSPDEYARVNKQNTMNQTKHTPGPWILGNTLAPFGISIWKAHDPERNVARICQNVSTIANAKLISSAPELLEACQFVLSQLSPDGFNGQAKLYSDCLHPYDDEKTVVDMLREAIAKAEGSAQ